MSDLPLAIVAEDEAMLRLVVEQNLEECGFTVVAVADGADGLRQAKLHPECQLLVTEVRMPIMDGYALASEVLALHPHLPIMILTGYADPLQKNCGIGLRFFASP